jgi:hypothetical protein
MPGDKDKKQDSKSGTKPKKSPGKAGRGDTGKGRRNRSPADARRDPSLEEQSEEEQLKDNTHARGPKKSFPKSKNQSGRTDKGFKPGSYPTLFNADTGEHPTEERQLVADWIGLSKAILKHSTATTNNPNMEQMLAHKFLGRGPDSKDAYHRDYCATGFLCGAQSIVKTTAEHNRSTDQSNFLLRMGINHSKTMRTITNQIGCVEDVSVGETLVYPYIDSQTFRGCRAAWNVHDSWDTEPDDDLSEVVLKAGESGMLPSNAKDPLFDLQLREALAAWMLSHGYHWLRVLPDLPVLSGADPPWWASITAAHQPTLAPLFAARPADEAAWVKWLNSLDHTLLTALGIRPERQGGFRDFDLSFGANPKNRTTAIVTKWAPLSANLPTYMETADQSGLSKDGSLCQLAKTTVQTSGMVLFCDRIQRAVTIASLHALFPIEPVFLGRSRLKREARYSAQRNLDELRNVWITKDVKSRPT